MSEPPDELPPVPPVTADADSFDAGEPSEPPALSPPPPLRPPPPPAAPPDLSPRPFHFTGEGAEYFRIWIVNLLLSVVTLGIYSAWAKVRRLRYFYGHTALDGHSFGYHASPIAILKGRLIAYAVVIGLALASEFAPILATVLYLPLLVLAPLIVVRSLRFRAINSSYRGIRFAFDGLDFDAYKVFLFWPLTVPLSLGLAYPYVAKRQREFFVSDSRYGRSQFGLEVPTGRVYRIYALAAVVMLVWFGAGVAALVGMIGSLTDLSREPSAMPSAALIGGAALLYAGFGVMVVAVRTAFENLVWNHTLVDHHRFESRLRPAKMLWLYVSNILGVVVTLGLFVPWARVRMAKYRAESLTLLPGGALQSAAMSGLEAQAAGGELSDAMDLDFGL